MSFPEPFLTQLAKEKQLAERETEVFLALFGKAKTRLEIAASLNVQESAVNTCLSGVYRKFGISASGPVKERQLKDELKRREETWQRQRSTNSSVRPSTLSQLEDTLVQKVREYCRQKILTQHSKMRLLSGDEIGVDQLYVDVWLLNRSPRTFQVSQSKLLETFDLRNDRLGLSDRIVRTPGFEVANANPKLLILGKPGAGKTTFLKHLIVDWCKGEFQPDLIAMLIEFRRIRDRPWDLLAAIDKELGLENWSQIQAINKQIKDKDLKLLQKLKEEEIAAKLKEEEIAALNQEITALKQQLESLPLQVLLKQGKLLVLMDGLDEVPTSELRREVQDQLRQVAENYPNNRLILTCRTQIMTSIPVGFTSVEVADFKPEQVKQFVKNWFKAGGKSDAETEQQWEIFDNAVGRNPGLKELTVTPVLLSLMCLVLQDEGEIHSQLTWLYQKGIKLLLRKWNDAKAITGWAVGSETYRLLTVERKEALLTEIAARKFENPKSFVLFEQEEIATYITEFLQLASRSEGNAILKAIEAQHGLLIERADELWSFSHLTFQEHFTVQWLTQLSSEELARKIANEQWQEVVKQLVKSQQPADRLVQLIKQAIEQSIASDLRLQEFLNWVFQKSKAVQAFYKSAAIRAFYIALNCALNHNRDFTLDLNLAPALDRSLALDRDFALKCIRDLDDQCDVDRARALASERNRTHALNHTLALALALARNRDLASDLAFVPKLANAVEQHRAELSKSSSTNEEFQQWWQEPRMQWIERPHEAMIKPIEHRNIGHDWQFTDEQKEQLQRYYNANKFLVDLINITGAVSKNVRSEIEDDLLLPWDKLKRLHPEIYGQA